MQVHGRNMDFMKTDSPRDSGLLFRCKVCIILLCLSVLACSYFADGEAADGSIRCPFDIQDADFIPQHSRQAYIFEILERTHIRQTFAFAVSPLLDFSGVAFLALVSVLLNVYQVIVG